MQKISTAFVAAQVEQLQAKLRQAFGYLADMINIRQYRHATIVWVEIGLALCRRSLRREMRRFGLTLEKTGVVEHAEIYSPFKVSYS